MSHPGPRGKAVTVNIVQRRKRGAHNVVPADSVRLSPGAHHEGIIEGNDSDNVHSLLTEVWQVLNISGNMVD